MRINILFTLIKKELMSIVKDKKVLFSLFILPLLLYPFIMVMGIFVSLILMNEEPDSLYLTLSENTPISFIEHLEDYPDYNIEISDEENSIDVYFVTDTQIEVTYDSANSNQSNNFNKLEEIFEDYSDKMVRIALHENKIDLKVLELNNIVINDKASANSIVTNLFSSIVPLLLLMMIVTSSIQSSTDSIAGEKERGTLETMFSSPITSLEHITSKLLSVILVSCMSAIINLTSLFLCFSVIIIPMGDFIAEVGFTLNVIELLQACLFSLISAIIFSVLFSTINLALSCFANSSKEAQSYLSPVMIVVMFMGYASLLITRPIEIKEAIIPGINTVLLIADAFRGDTNIFMFILANFINLTLAIVCIYGLSKIFKSEKVIFSESKGFSLFLQKTNRLEERMPKVGDGILLFIINIILINFVGIVIPGITSEFYVTMFITQLFIGIPCLIYTYLLKANPKELFRFNKFDSKWILGGTFLVLAGFIINLLIQSLLIRIFPNLNEMLQILNSAFVLDNLLLSILVICVCPGVFEELLFRGFILKSFNLDKRPYVAILFTSILFGIFHMNIFQFFTGLILGSIIGYVCYKSNSIIPAMILHFINNFFATLLDYFSIEFNLLASNSTMIFIEIGGVIMIAAVLVILGKRLLPKYN